MTYSIRSLTVTAVFVLASSTVLLASNDSLAEAARLRRQLNEGDEFLTSEILMDSVVEEEVVNEPAVEISEILVDSEVEEQEQVVVDEPAVETSEILVDSEVEEVGVDEPVVETSEILVDSEVLEEEEEVVDEPAVETSEILVDSEVLEEEVVDEPAVVTSEILVDSEILEDVDEPAVVTSEILVDSEVEEVGVDEPAVELTEEDEEVVTDEPVEPIIVIVDAERELPDNLMDPEVELQDEIQEEEEEEELVEEEEEEVEEPAVINILQEIEAAELAEEAAITESLETEAQIETQNEHVVSLDLEQAAMEAEEQIQQQRIKHEYEEALLRATQLQDQARYEQEHARTAAQEHTTNQEAHDHAVEVDHMADLMIQEAMVQIEDFEEANLDFEVMELQSE